MSVMLVRARKKERKKRKLDPKSNTMPKRGPESLQVSLVYAPNAPSSSCALCAPPPRSCSHRHQHSLSRLCFCCARSHPSLAYVCFVGSALVALSLFVKRRARGFYFFCCCALWRVSGCGVTMCLGGRRICGVAVSLRVLACSLSLSFVACIVAVMVIVISVPIPLLRSSLSFHRHHDDHRTRNSCLPTCQLAMVGAGNETDSGWLVGLCILIGGVET
jgi:hypothetical protein